MQIWSMDRSSKKRQGRLHELAHRMCCGAERLEKLGLPMSTSLIECLNLPLTRSATMVV
jgi:hypothetical protein